VAPERVLALNVIGRLAQEFAKHFAIEAIAWEREPIQAIAPFQEQIPRAEQSDICVFILWSRLGTPVMGHDGRRYDSGTEYEFLDALASRRARGAPDLLVYRKTGDPMVSARLSEAMLLEYIRQQRAVEGFIGHWFRGEDGSFTAGFHEFATAADFEDRLDAHLRKLILSRLQPRRQMALAVGPV
jgi:hypothetical protein